MDLQNDNSSINENIAIYKKFVRIGFIQTILSRLTSLIYIVIISRLIVPEEYDLVVILSIIGITFGSLSHLGLHYAAVHFAQKYEETKEQTLALPIQTGIYLAIPVILIAWEIGLRLAYYWGISGRLFFLKNDHMTRTVFDVFLVVTIIFETLQIRFNANLQTDRSAKSLTISSVLQSFLIPLFYFIYQNLTSIFIAWIVSILIPLFIWRVEITDALRVKIDPKHARNVLTFGFPIFALNSYGVLATYMARFVIFFEFPEGNTTLYHWVLRFNELLFASIAVLQQGLFPLLIKHTKDRETSRIISDNQIYFRIVSAVCQVSFGGLILFSRFLLKVVLPPEYITGLSIFYVISFGMMLKMHVVFLEPHISTHVRRRLIVSISIFISTINIILPLLLIKFGLIGISTTMFVSSLVSILIISTILKQMKFGSVDNLFYPIIIAILNVGTVILIHSQVDSLLFDLFLILLYIPVSYVYLRITKIIRKKELDVVYRVLPNKISEKLQKILF